MIKQTNNEQTNKLTHNTPTKQTPARPATDPPSARTHGRAFRTSSAYCSREWDRMLSASADALVVAVGALAKKPTATKTSGNRVTLTLAAPRRSGHGRRKKSQRARVIVFATPLTPVLCICIQTFCDHASLPKAPRMFTHLLLGRQCTGTHIIVFAFLYGGLVGIRAEHRLLAEDDRVSRGIADSRL